MQVGTRRPTLRPAWMERNKAWQALARLEWLAAWFFYLFRTAALFRFAVEATAAGLLIFGAIGVYTEFQQRDVDRGVRIATLSAQIAEMRALPNYQGMAALKPIVEALVREGVPTRDFDLSGAILVGAELANADLSATYLSHALMQHANLSGADLSRSNLCRSDLAYADLSNAKLFSVDLSYSILSFAKLGAVDFSASFLDNAILQTVDLTGASLVGTILRKANLKGANLTRADLTDAVLHEAVLTGANLAGVVLSGADLTNADLRGVEGLSSDQLETACAEAGKRPQLTEPLVWNGGACEPWREVPAPRDCVLASNPRQ